MAIYSIKEIHEGRDGELLMDSRTRTRVFRTITTDNQDNAKTVEDGIAASAFAVTLGSTYPTDTNCYCHRIRSNNAAFSKRVWVTTCEYVSNDPLSEPAEIDWDTEKQSKILTKDKDDVWVVNSAGFFYDPPLEVDDSRINVRVSKNVAAMPLWFPLGYKDAVNSDQFSIDGRTVAVGKAKMNSVSLSAFQNKSGIPYRKLTMSISLSETGWDAYLLDSGFYQIDSTNVARRVKIWADDGNEPTQPWPLDGSGYKLANPSPANVVYRQHRPYKTAVFGSLPLT